MCNSTSARIQVTQVKFGNGDCLVDSRVGGPASRSHHHHDHCHYTKRLVASHSSSANCQTEIISRSANSCINQVSELTDFGRLSVRLGASAGFHILSLSLSIHSTASLWPKIILYKWMDFLIPCEIWHEKLHRDNQPKFRIS